MDNKEIEKLRKEKVKAEKKNNLKEVSQICNYLGELLAKQGKFQEAKLEHALELQLSEDLGDTIGSAVACRKIGECYSSLEQFDKAIQYQERYLSTARSCDNTLEEQRAYATIGRTYLLQSDTLRSRSDTTAALDNAENAFRKSLNICLKLKSEVKTDELMEMKARLYLNMGLVFDAKNERDQCAEYMKKAISISEQYKLDNDLYRCQLSLSSMYQRGGNYSQAQRYLEAALRCAIKLKDKFLESEALVQKAVVSQLIGDFTSSKHALKKSYKLGVSSTEEKERITKLFRSVSKLEDLTGKLKKSKENEVEDRYTLFEKLGDCSADLGNFKQAVDYYLLMLHCAQKLNKSPKCLIPIYISLARTYADMKEYKQAIIYYRKELVCREGDHGQGCRTWLNIAECEELDGQDYDVISNCYLKAFELAMNGKHRKLQVHVLKGLIAVQEVWQKKTHKEQTLAKIYKLKDKYDVKSDEELTDEETDSQNILDDSDDACSIGDLTDSESDEETRRDGAPSRAVSKRLISKRNEKGETPLHRACIEGNLKKVESLIAQGHPPNPRDYCGWTPLHEAANHGFHDVVEYLVGHGANINDRGGQHCGGVTPLIDAASCGNLEVMEILVKKGANLIAKDDEGNTALDCLRQWHNRCETPLEGHELDLFRSLEISLKSRVTMDTAGSSSFTPRGMRSSQTVSRSPLLPHMSPPKKKLKEKKQNDQRRRTSSSSEEDEIHNNLHPNGQTLPDLPRENHVNTMLEADTTSATNTYRNAIMRVGSSAANRKPSQSPAVCKSHDQGAFVTADEFIDDDWLIDDVHQPTKRRRLDLNGIFTSNNTKTKLKRTKNSASKKNNQENVYENNNIVTSQRNRQILLDSDSDENEDEESELTVMRSTGNVLEDSPVVIVEESPDANSYTAVTNDSIDIYSQNVIFNEEEEEASYSTQSHHQGAHHTGPPGENESSNDSFVSLLSTDSNFQDDIPKLSKLSTKSKKNKAKQLKLTQLGIGHADDRPVALNSMNRSVVRDVSAVDTGSINSTSAEIMSTQQSTVATTMNPSNINASVLRLKVRVKDKVLLVPVQNSEDKTISWLCGQVANRYFALTGLRPLLTLGTPDGAVLSAEDNVNLVLSGTEILATVDRWDLPPISERYSEACKTLNAVNYRNIRNKLITSEETGCLDLSSLSLKSAQMDPVLRTLKCECSLKVIDLSGNKLGNGCLDELVTLCRTLTGLTTLSLGSNNIDCHSLQGLANVLSTNADKSEVFSETLTDLDLSCNPLGDLSCPHLITLIDALPALMTLNLRGCGFSAKFFQDSRVKFASCIKKSSIRVLDVSHNNLDSLGIELLLKSMNPHLLRSLSLCANIDVTSNQSHLLRHLLNYVNQPGCVLEDLDISSCRMVPDDLDFLLRILVVSQHMEKLNLSYNHRLGNVYVTRLMETSATDSCKLEHLEMVGCSLSSPLDTNFLDSLSDKLASSHPLKSFHFTCRNLEKIDIDSLKQVWTERWEDASKVEINGTCVVMSVRDLKSLSTLSN